MVISVMKLVVLTLPAVQRNSIVITVVVFLTVGNVIRKMIVVMVPMRVIPALRKLAPTTSSLVLGPGIASPRIGFVMVMMIVLINRTNRTVHQSLVCLVNSNAQILGSAYKKVTNVMVFLIAMTVVMN